MQSSSLVVCSLLLATLSPQVFSIKILGDVQKPSRGRLTTASTTASTTAVTVIDFGGSHHGIDAQGENMRPEAVKMQVCEEPVSKCSECVTQASCFRGVGAGRLKLDVEANASANYYAAEMWASCAGGNGKYYVTTFLNGFVNGVLKIFVDGSLHRTVHASDITPAPRYWHGGLLHTVLPIAKNTRVRVEFERSTAGQPASSYISLWVNGVDEYVDFCMGVKNCLASLGDGSDSAFLFRNSNAKQHACLVANSTGERDGVSDHCNVWGACVSNSGIDLKLKAFLGAVLTSHGSLADGATNFQKFNDVEGCVDPSVEDPESWECECMDEMTVSCGGVNEECFNKILCNQTKVCESWKEAHCAVSVLAKQKDSIKSLQKKIVAFNHRGAQSAIASLDDQGKVTASIDSRLDQTLSGKCAM